MPFYDSGNIACDISGITTKAPCEVALSHNRWNPSTGAIVLMLARVIRRPI